MHGRYFWGTTSGWYRCSVSYGKWIIFFTVDGLCYCCFSAQWKIVDAKLEEMCGYIELFLTDLLFKKNEEDSEEERLNLCIIKKDVYAS